MIEVGQVQSAAPFTTEQRGSATLTASSSKTVVIANLPTGKARRIDILLKQAATGAGKGVSAVYLRSYAGGREWYHEIQINAAFTTATHAVVVSDPFSTATNEWAIGETVDIALDNGTDSNAVIVWAIARW